MTASAIALLNRIARRFIHSSSDSEALQRGLLAKRGLTARWIQRLAQWLTTQGNPVRLQTNSVNLKWTPLQLYEKEAVEAFSQLHELERKR